MRYLLWNRNSDFGSPMTFKIRITAYGYEKPAATCRRRLCEINYELLFEELLSGFFQFFEYLFSLVGVLPELHKTVHALVGHFRGSFSIVELSYVVGGVYNLAALQLVFIINRGINLVVGYQSSKLFGYILLNFL